MNMILHNIPSATIENGDTLQEPLIPEGSSWKKFDIVIANPPFSQNYSRTDLKFPTRFSYGFAPETGKKADLMFVQHMIASLKTTGRMATVMPHGVLFRGGSEKAIRQGMIEGNIIEAIISLPPALFYGTGIPACVLVINKNKPDALENKILFLNADAEFAEGKVQNILRPEDIEKINYVYTHKPKDIDPKYARLVGLEELRNNDYNLNIRRYVDNTPAPEPEDVRAHLSGGIPISEIDAQQAQFDKFGFLPAEIFKNRKEHYADFQTTIINKADLKTVVEANAPLQATYAAMQQRLDEWWELAKADFASLAPAKETEVIKEEGNLQEGIMDFIVAGGKNIATVRSHLLSTLKEKLLSRSVLNEFQCAGVFVNWWTNIRYDLKTISSTGWSPALIPREYFIQTYFTEEEAVIQATEKTIADAEATVQESFENVDYEGEEGEEVSTTTLKAYLKAAATADPKGEETKLLQTIKEAEAVVKAGRKTLKEQRTELERKIDMKCYGIEDEKAELSSSIKTHKKSVVTLQGPLPADTKTATKQKAALKKATTALAAAQERLAGLEAFLESIGGVITEEEAKTLILQKHRDLIQAELLKYLNAEKRALTAGIEKLWDKYAVSATSLEGKRTDTLEELNAFLTELNYLG